MQGIGQDLRYAMRMLMKNPGYSVMAVLLLAIGIGINTAVFSILDCLMIRSLPVAEPKQIAEVLAKRQGQHQSFTYPEYEEIISQSKSFSSFLASSRHGAMLYREGESEMLRADWVSENYFSVLGIRPIIGQGFASTQDWNLGNTPQVVISYGLWQRRFGSDPAIVGKTISLNRNSAVILGVAPPSFGGLKPGVMVTEIWMPVHQWEPACVQDWKCRDFDILGRVRAGVNIETVRAELDAIAHRLAQTYPDTNKGTSYLAKMSENSFFASLIMSAVFLSGPFLILLICCANVAGIGLARGETRRKEIAMRLALGAGRKRLVRQLLTESFLLVIPGVALGLILTHWLLSMQSALLPPMESIRLDLRLDWRVLAFALAASMVSVVLSGLIPAFQAAKVELYEILKGAVGTRKKRSWLFGFRNMLTMGQIALALVLLIAGGLFFKSLMLCKQINPGFDARKNALIINAALNIPPKESSQKFFLPVMEQIMAIPGVKNATYAMRMLLSGSGGGVSCEASIPGVENPPGQKGFIIKYNSVGRDYFRVVGATILRGREFNSAEESSNQHTVIINESMAKRFWRRNGALGRYIKVNDRSFQIVGIARDGKINAIDEKAEPYIYFSFSQVPRSEGSLIIETAGPPLESAAAVKKKIRSFDKSAVIVETTTVEAIVDNALYIGRIMALVSGSAGILGIIITAIGLYGILSFISRRRTREVGIRIALGAQRRDISRLVVENGIIMAAVGITAGLIISFFAMQLIASVLYGVMPTDIWIYSAGSIAILLITLWASWIPAHRAAKTDPVTALRYE